MSKHRKSRWGPAIKHHREVTRKGSEDWALLDLSELRGILADLSRLENSIRGNKDRKPLMQQARDITSAINRIIENSIDANTTPPEGE